MMVEESCPHCGQPAGATEAEPGQPFCPSCRAAVDVLPVVINGHVVQGGIRIRLKKPKKLGPIDIMRNVPEVFHQTGRDQLRNRTIIKKTDHYDETIIDTETGQALVIQNEPLSQHQGHGSARKAKLRRDGDGPPG